MAIPPTPTASPSWIPSIAGGVVSLGGSILSTVLGNQANKSMAEYQYQKDLEMWNRTNEYNSPQAQMARLKAAGLNPNLVYGTGATANTAPATMPKYQAPRMETVHDAGSQVMSTMSNYMDLKAKQAQIDNLQAQTNNAKIDGLIKTEQAANASDFYKYNAESLSERIRNMISQTNRNDILNKLTQSQTNETNFRLKNLLPQENTLKGQQIRNLIQSLEQSTEQTQLIKSQRFLNENQAKYGANAPWNTQNIIQSVLKLLLGH